MTDERYPRLGWLGCAMTGHVGYPTCCLDCKMNSKCKRCGLPWIEEYGRDR